MRRVTNQLVSVLGVLVLLGGLGACGDDDSGPIGINDLESAYMRNYCEVAIDCDFDVYVAFFGGDVDTCLEFLESSGGMENGLQTLIDSVNAGNTSYDGALARQCLNAMQSLSCGEIYGAGSPDPACDETFTGLLGNGTDCTMDEECSGGWCDMTTACPGVCANRVLLGGDCSMGQTCEFGAECEAGMCILDPGPLGLGDDCVESYRECAYGLWCDWSGNGVCENRVAAGQTCENQQQCQHGLWCNGEGRCAEVELASHVGDACGGFEEAPFCNLGLGLGCVAEYTDALEYTVCAQMLQAGGTCMEQDPSTEVVTVTPCDMFANLYCDMDMQNYTGVCMTKKAGGQQCVEDEECQSDYCQMDGTCLSESTDPCD
ncbi:MAG: hypothetical protein ABI333_20280 [bacterium]